MVAASGRGSCGTSSSRGGHWWPSIHIWVTRRTLGPIWIGWQSGPGRVSAWWRGTSAEAEEILRQARSRGLQMPVLGGDGLEGIEEAGAIADGVYLSSSYLPTLETASNRAFLQAYRKKFPKAGLPNQPAAATYDAVYMLREVFARAGSKREDVRRALAQVGTSCPRSKA